MDPIYDVDLLWLRENYLDEMPHVEWITDPGDFALEMDASRGNSLYAKWRDRIGSDSYMDEYRRVLLPFHEAVKRLGPGPEQRWLRYALNWRGLPCLCAHVRITAHLADVDHTHEVDVAGGIRTAARRVIMKLERFDIQRGSGRVAVGRQAGRIWSPTDSAPVPRTAGPRREADEDPGVTNRGIGSKTRAQEKSLHDAPLCACHASLHGRPPKDRARDAA